MSIKNRILLIIMLIGFSACAGIKVIFYFAHSYMAKEISQFVGLEGEDREKIESDLKKYKNQKLIQLMKALTEDVDRLILFNQQIKKSKNPQKYHEKFRSIYASISKTMFTFQEDLISIVSPYVVKLNKKQQAKLMLNLEKSFDQKRVMEFPSERKFNKFKRNKIETRLKFFIGDMTKQQKHLLKRLGKDLIITKAEQLKWQNQFKRQLAQLFNELKDNQETLSEEKKLQKIKSLFYDWGILRTHDPKISERRAGMANFFFQLLIMLNPQQRNLLEDKLTKIRNTLKSLTAN